MKPISSDLSAAWRLGQAEPEVRVVVDDRLAHGLRFAWTETYNTGADPGLGHAAVVSAGTGTIHRARLVWTGTSYDVQTQRITDPASVSQWTTWTTRVTGITTAGRDCALVARGDGSLWLIWGEQIGGNAALRTMVSLDDGQTWGAAATALAWPGSSIASVAAAENAAGTALGVACLVDTGSGYGARLALRVAGVWSDWADATGLTATSAHGVALAWTGATDATLLLATDGADGPALAVRTVTGADGTSTPAWTARPEPRRRFPGSPVWFGAPRLAPLGSDFPGWFVTFVETDGATCRLMGAFARHADWFVAPYELATIGVAAGPPGGGVLLRRGADWWLVTYGSSRTSPAWTGSVPGDRVEVASARLVAVEEMTQATDTAAGEMGRLSLTLDNADGALAGAGTPGDAWRAIRAGSRLALGIGYRWAGVPTGGAEVVWGAPWVVERVAWVDRAGTGHVVVEAVDALSWLRRTPLASDLTLANLTLAELVDRVLWRLAESDSGALEARLAARTVAAAALRAGGTLGELLDQATAAAGVWLRAGTDAAAADPTAFAAWANSAFVRWDAAAASAAYGPDPATQGSIRLAEWWQSAAAVNRVLAVGANAAATSPAGDTTAAARLGLDGWLAVRRPLVDDPAWAADVADWELARTRLDAAGGWLNSRPHPGLELYDVVAVTASRAGLSADPRRVVGRRTRYDRRRAEYVQRLWLAGT